ncbi:MAG: hypothetical protein GY754_10935 [bacterium]|nr:hypothetical protein [bacterium]
MGYSFPVTDKFHARTVTELDYKINPLDPTVFVDLDPVRGQDYLEGIKFTLNIAEDSLKESTDSFIKIIFSGHKGTGKSLELERFHNYIDDPERYLSVFIDIEKEFEVAKFQPQDLFVILIAKLIETIAEKQIALKSNYLEEIINDWLSEKEVLEELKKSYKLDIGSEIEAGVSILGFLKLKSKLKALFSYESKTSTSIRQKIKKNPLKLIERFNMVLLDLRDILKKENKGKDILFVSDGTEKVPYETYTELFVQDSNLIRAIDCNCIFSVPISSYFDIENSPSSGFFQTYTLPMVPPTKESIPLLGTVITKRINGDTFIEENALQFCVKMSGGCIRQLLRIVNTALTTSLGSTITLKIAKKAAEEVGRRMFELLDSAHMDILLEEKYQTADKKVLDLLFSLAVLKYNGKRDINPLLKPFVKDYKKLLKSKDKS